MRSAGVRAFVCRFLLSSGALGDLFRSSGDLIVLGDRGSVRRPETEDGSGRGASGNGEGHPTGGK